MAWFSGKVNLGNFPDLSGAVNKFSESVKNIEKNFDSALGLEEKSESSNNEASGFWPSDRKNLFDPVMAFMGQKGEESGTDDSSAKPEYRGNSPKGEEEGVETDKVSHSLTGRTTVEVDKQKIKNEKDDEHPEAEEKTDFVNIDTGKVEAESETVSVEPPESAVDDIDASDSNESVQQKETEPSENSGSVEIKSEDGNLDVTVVPAELHGVVNIHENVDEQKALAGEIIEKGLPVHSEASEDSQARDRVELSASHSAEEDQARYSTELTALHSSEDNQARDRTEFSAAEGTMEEVCISSEASLPITHPSDEILGMVSESIPVENDTKDKGFEVDKQIKDDKPGAKEEQNFRSGFNESRSEDLALELEKLKMEMKMMENALQGAARQAQAKADEIAKMMNDNEQLKAVIEDLKRKSNDAEIESLREEYHQRVATLERKVYALTKERDTLRREQNKKSDAAALLKEKDEIINQIMAEGEELSKKQASQESQIRKLRAQIRELEEEKKGLATNLQVEENKVESIKKDKSATEKLLQETIEKHQAELATQKEFYTNALTAAKEAEALAEARANNEARTELESRLREAQEREAMLVQTLEELRQTLSRKEQQAVFREDMLRKEIEDYQKRYQESERRCEELITQVPESTRPLLRQIEAIQETTARRAEAWAAVERSLNSRHQEAEAKAAAAEEKERSMNERLSQTLSRINVLEAQISCLRAEQTQMSRSLEKERQRAAENRQEYLAAKEEVDTLEGRANQLEEEIRELKRKHKQELQDALMRREFLEQELEKEKAARMDMERTSHVLSTVASDQAPLARHSSAFENGSLSRKLSTASSLGSMEGSYFLQASLDSSDSFSERRYPGEATESPFFMKSMTPSAFEAALRQKEGELASYMSRLASMESIRDSLAEELVKLTAECEKFKTEAAMLPGTRAELEALRRRHAAALELMGERDEELEELRNDIVDLKEMYREQVNMLVNQIQTLS